MNDAAKTRGGLSDIRLPGGSALGPFVALVTATVLRLHGLGRRPVWTDEGSTWTAARLDVTELLHRCVHRDASPPLYYLLTSWVIKTFGDGEVQLRLVTALASIVLVWLTYRLARLGLGRGPATFAAFLTAVSPFQVQYAQEARTYTLVAMFLVGSTYVFARLQQRPGPRRWLPLVLLTAGGLWTQSIAALGTAVQGFIAVVTPTGRRRFWPWAGAMAVAGLLYLPWFLYSREMAHRLGDSHWYVPAPDRHAVFKVIRAILISPFPIVTAPTGSPHPGLGALMPPALAHLLLALPPVLALLITLPQAMSRSAKGFLSRLCWTGWVLPLVAVYIASQQQSLMLHRYFVFATPFVTVLYAHGLASLGQRTLRVALGAALIAVSAFGLFRYDRDFTKEPWRQLVTYIRTVAVPGRTIILVPFDVDPVRYYLRDGKSGLVPYEVAHPNQPFSARFTPRELYEAARAAELESRAYDEVWVVIRSANNDDRWRLAERTMKLASRGRRIVEDRIWLSYGAPMIVVRYQRPALADSVTKR